MTSEFDMVEDGVPGNFGDLEGTNSRIATYLTNVNSLGTAWLSLSLCLYSDR